MWACASSNRSSRPFTALRKRCACAAAGWSVMAVAARSATAHAAPSSCQRRWSFRNVSSAQLSCHACLCMPSASACRNAVSSTACSVSSHARAAGTSNTRFGSAPSAGAPRVIGMGARTGFSTSSAWYAVCV